jgi:hypothetical protein
MFWKKPKKFRDGVDYKLIDYNEDQHAVQIIGQQFQNVVYYYTGAKLIQEGELYRLQFGYEIIDSAEFDLAQLKEDDSFHELMGNILTDIMVEQDEKTRNDYTEELD